jgi:Type IV secretion system pilin
MFAFIKKQILSLILGIFLVSAFVTSIPAQAQVSLPNVCPSGGCPLIGTKKFENYKKEDVAALIIFIANLLTYIVGALAVLFVIFGGILMIVGRGDEGWKMIKGAFIGLVVAIFAYSAVYLVGQIAQTNLFNV